MGVRRPSGISCTVPARAPSAAILGNAALVHAEVAYRQAVRAAADHACAGAAARIVGAEVASTSRRVRALRRRWARSGPERRGTAGERDGPSTDRSARR
jgi:V/A-type H+-transporting ATPase subunit D